MRRSEFFIGGENVNDLTAAHAMESRVRFCHPDHGWRDLSLAMVENSFSALPVVDSDSNLVGIVTESNLLKIVLEGRNEEDVKAKDLMTENPATVSENTPLSDVIKILDDKNLVRLPVVKNNKLVGIVTRRDLLLCHMKATAEPPHWI